MGSERRHDPRIASLRGFACLLLVGYHVIGADAQSGLRIQNELVRDLNDLMGYLRMPTFALLAGVLQGHASPVGVIRSYLASKAQRLLIPMFVVGTIFAVLQSMVPSTNDSISDWRTLHLLPVAHYWFLWAIFWNFAFAAICDRLGIYRRPGGGVAAIGVSAMACLLLPGTPWLAIDGALYLLPFFTLGLVLGRHGNDFSKLSSGWGFISLVAFAGAALWAGVPTLGENRRQLQLLIPSLLASFALIKLWPRITVLERVGDSSYAIFLYHVFFTAGVRILAEDSGALSAVWLIAPVAFLAGILGPLLLEKVLRLQRWTAMAGLGLNMRERST